jgi:Tol biopolymer transport system component
MKVVELSLLCVFFLTFSFDEGNAQIQKKGSPFSHSISFTHSQATSGLDTVRYILSAGWNMVSMPFKVPDGTKSSVFPHAASSGFSYDHLYIQHDSLTSGVGYWLKFPAPETLVVSECVGAIDTLFVKKGWNMIGSPRRNKAVADITTVPSNLIVSPYWQYVPGKTYQQVDSLEPGKAYWVKASTEGVLALYGAGCPQQSLPESPYGSPDWYPSGSFIGFNYLPLIRMERGCRGDCKIVHYYWNFDSLGYWIINQDGSNQRRIFPFPLENVAWSPDSVWIAFENGGEIFKMQFTGETFDTTTVTQLTAGGNNFFPTWSPDGQWIAYDSNLNDSVGANVIWKMKADGSEKRDISQHGTGEWRMPNWSPDGNHIVHQRYVSDIPEIVSMDTSGMNAVQLNYNDQFESYPKYSPNGLRIAFWSQSFVDNSANLWIMNADGNNLRQLTFDGADQDFDWSPDGQQIVYTRFESNDFSYTNGTIWILNVNTLERKQLTFNNSGGN